ncbi:hypothetical protein [Parasphingorhabdus halotolerans]|uniref:Uncharacterized protein n=1 Tax=Parasphingorhabdus halotolerans TaxID=2725558 RepID=A0A6H2DLB1_9SPHN|nr:hypothetical protein [Parasphingorhabdus halotolerans]QJB69462.1 hypothetical protein HF685_09360 [Parasphingorhabdus halotolerans]
MSCDGNLTSTDAGQRFSEKFDSRNFSFTEKNGTGALLTVSGQYALDATGEYTILRPSDLSTLRFLGFSKPSFQTL